MRVLLTLSITTALLLLASCSKPAESKPAASPTSTPKEPEHATPRVKLAPDTAARQGIVLAVAEASTTAEGLVVPGQFKRNEDRTWHVGAVAAGRVVKTFFNLGDPVKEGQTLAQLHSHDVHDSRADLAKAEAMLTQARTNLDLSVRARDRARRLLALKSVSQEQMDAAEASARNAQQAVSAAESEVDKHRTHLEEFLNVPAKEGAGTDFVPVLSPANAVVLERAASAGSVVEMGQTLFTISDLSSLWLIAAVQETDARAIRKGGLVDVRVNAFPDQQLRGTVLSIGESVDPATRTLQVRVLVPNPALRLRPEMFASIAFPTAQQLESVLIPDSAVQEVNGQRVVFVEVAPAEYEVRPVDLGSNLSGKQQVRGGLRPGEKVVARGGFVLKSELLKRSLAEEE